MTAASEHWSTTHLPPAAQFAAWRDVIVDAHLAWDIPDIGCERFPAYMHQHRVDALRVTDCSTRRAGPRQPQPGADRARRRGLPERGADRRRRGAAALRPARGRRVQLDAGMFTLWDSTRPMRFATNAQLRQISLIVPEPNCCAACRACAT